MRWLITLLVIFIIGCSENIENNNGNMQTTEQGDNMDLKNIKWFGHSSFMIKDEKTGNNLYYIDPFEFKGDGREKANIVFITHAHFDHCSPEDVKKILKQDTTIVLVNGCDSLKNLSKSTLLVEPNKEYEVKGLKFRTVPAYNLKAERLKFHPQENKWVGYIFNVNNTTIYHAGDTDFIPEMKALGKINIAMLPIGGTYTMDADEAIQAANAINADITVPMHYRRLNPDNYAEIEDKFKKGVKGKVVILEQYS